MRTQVNVSAAAAAVWLLSACAGVDGAVPRDLTAEEIEVLAATRARLVANEAAVRESLADLADNVGYALGQQHRLSSSIARAQLLEAMRSPWTKPESATTRREVALYHLFALSEAERVALSARIAAREARIQAIASAYGRLMASMSVLVAAQEQLLAQLDPPASTQVGLVMRQVIAESQAFRSALDTNNSPRLERLAATVAEHERAVAAAEARIVDLLEALEQE